MSLPLYPHSAFGYFGGLLAGTLIGMGFGFALERAGFGRARNLAAQFYLNDVRVLKVMFTGIVTALAGMALLSGLGVLDLSLVTVPETFLWPQLVGGLLLGIGFIVSGYCPGTAVVAAASGNLDGLVSLAGVMLGSLAFGFAYDPLERFYTSGAMGVVRLPDLLGVPIAVVAAAVVAMAVGAFVGGEKLEAIFSRKYGEPAPVSPRAVKARVFGGFALVSGLALLTLALPRPVARPAPQAVARVSPLALAKRVASAPDGLWLVDLRPAGAKGGIPGAMTVPADDPGAAFLAKLPATRELVVFAEAEPPSLPSGFTRYAGPKAVLTGGYAAWEAAVLTAPAPPDSATPELIAEFRIKNALFARFTGVAAEPVKMEVKPAAAPATAPKKGGGC